MGSRGDDLTSNNQGNGRPSTKGQRLTDRDAKRPVTNGEHDKNDFYNLDERVGHIWSKTGKWDNGLYVTAFMKTVPVQFLVDSGSTLTVISYNLFMKMCTDKELKLQKNDCQIKDANSKNFKNIWYSPKENFVL